LCRARRIIARHCNRQEDCRLEAGLWRKCATSVAVLCLHLLCRKDYPRVRRLRKEPEESVSKRFFLIPILYLLLSSFVRIGVAGEDLMSRGKVFESEQRWSEAFSAYSEVIKQDPTNALAHQRLGAVSEKLGASDQALKSYQEALRLNPGMSEASSALAGYYTNQGVAQRRNNQLDAAVQSFRQALTYTPSSANIHFELGQTLEQRGQIDEAMSLNIRKPLNLIQIRVRRICVWRKPTPRRSNRKTPSKNIKKSSA